MDIQEWLKQFKDHFEANPTHGQNCIKVDEFTRQLRQEIDKANLSGLETRAVKTAFNYIAQS